MIMRLDADAFRLYAGWNAYPATFRRYLFSNCPFCRVFVIAFFFLPATLVMEIRCRDVSTRVRSGEREFRFELYTLTFSTMRNFLCFDAECI